MGEITEMILEGVLCMSCGVVMDDLIVPGSSQLLPGPGYPRNCEECQDEEVL